MSGETGQINFETAWKSQNKLIDSYIQELTALRRKCEIYEKALNYYIEECMKSGHHPCDCLIARKALRSAGEENKNV